MGCLGRLQRAALARERLLVEARDCLPTLRFLEPTFPLDLAESDARRANSECTLIGEPASFPIEFLSDLTLKMLSEWASLSSSLNLDFDTPRTCAVSLAVANRVLIR